jgi:hypothetical protein
MTALDIVVNDTPLVVAREGALGSRLLARAIEQEGEFMDEAARAMQREFDARASVERYLFGEYVTDIDEAAALLASRGAIVELPSTERWEIDEHGMPFNAAYYD